MSTTDEFRKLSDITGATKNDKDKYYVYGLFEKEKTKPFYIGKGQGTRIFEHQIDARNILNTTEISNEEEYSKVSEKIRKIIESNGEIVPVIIKFGLTEQEAFVAESALINLYNFIAEKFMINSLTNIVSGHGTDKEKSTFSKDGHVKARTTDEFIENYNIPDFDVSIIKEPFIIIKINNTYTTGDSNEEIYEHVRGVWNISKNRLNKYNYVLALYRGICVGVYKIEGWKKACEHDGRFPFPLRKEGDDEAKIVKYNSIETLKEDEKEIYERIFSKTENPSKILERWRNKRFFYGDSKSEDVPEYLKNAVGKRLINLNKQINNQANPIYIP